jgi:hypothetical protein
MEVLTSVDNMTKELQEIFLSEFFQKVNKEFIRPFIDFLDYLCKSMTDYYRLGGSHEHLQPEFKREESHDV